MGKVGKEVEAALKEWVENSAQRGRKLHVFVSQAIQVQNKGRKWEVPGLDVEADMENMWWLARERQVRRMDALLVDKEKEEFFSKGSGLHDELDFGNHRGRLSRMCILEIRGAASWQWVKTRRRAT